jgi:hypothetical protein
MQRHDVIPRAWNWMFGKPKEGEDVLKPQQQSFLGGAMTPQRMNFLHPFSRIDAGSVRVRL